MPKKQPSRLKQIKLNIEQYQSRLKQIKLEMDRLLSQTTTTQKNIEIISFSDENLARQHKGKNFNN